MGVYCLVQLYSISLISCFVYFGFGREAGPLASCMQYMKNIDPECDEEPCNQDDQPREINQSIAVRC